MQPFFQRLAEIVSSRKGCYITVIVWLAFVLLLSFSAPSAKEHAISSSENSIHLNTPSAKARALAEAHFPSENGSIALLVFHNNTAAITQEQKQTIEAISKWLSSDTQPNYISGAMPYHQFPQNIKDSLYSKDGSTMLLNAALTKDIDSATINDTLDEIRDYAHSIGLNGLQLEITGPAGIASDTIELFSKTDLILLFSTVAIIVVILIVIYRSPLIALLPLLIAGIVYQVVDRIVGLAAATGWFEVDKQALSIMMILLFAVLTDYCLFVVARYREELGKHQSKHEAMKAAMTEVGEPILFSGGTVLLAVIVLFAAIFQPYHYFAPVFAVAMVIILLGGLTLIPAIFTLTGRVAFWPFAPKTAQKSNKENGLWKSIARFVTRKPAVVASSIVILMIAASLNVWSIDFSYNLMKSFPKELSSRQGFELLEQHFPKGRLAPVTILLESDHKLDSTSKEELNRIIHLKNNIEKLNGIGKISPNLTALSSDDSSNSLPRNFLSEDGRFVQLEMILEEHPYEASSLQTLKELRANSDALLSASGFDPASSKLHFAGQTAQQLDVRDMNKRDVIVVFSLVIALITIMLVFQAKSLLIAMTMMGTMLLSFTATFGISWAIVNIGFGYDAISYRLPLYSFVFLIALGVDYNIMLVSRILEESRKRPWMDAVMLGVSRTGGVISSAGIILAATFCVLMTQPLQELFLFGFIMAVGILLDTFIIRGMLLPAILVLIGKWIK
ncbi:MMPL family transporter [Paenibacillus sp. GSMTC-2017]|nr:MMPL family transporter [Paenibacillus sp. GSMTC-2017]